MSDQLRHACDEMGHVSIGDDFLFSRTGLLAAPGQYDTLTVNEQFNNLHQRIEDARTLTLNSANTSVFRDQLKFDSFPSGQAPYKPLGPNSNSFAHDLVTESAFHPKLPKGAPGPDVGPRIDMHHPNFPKKRP